MLTIEVVGGNTAQWHLIIATTKNSQEEVHLHGTR